MRADSARVSASASVRGRSLSFSVFSRSPASMSASTCGCAFVGGRHFGFGGCFRGVGYSSKMLGVGKVAVSSGCEAEGTGKGEG